MQIKLDRVDLNNIYEQAKEFFLTRHSIEVDAHIYPLMCQLQALCVVLEQKGINLEIQFPNRKLDTKK